MSDKKSLHAGHRERMRKRFAACRYELNSFSDHEIIEMLLFSSYKRQNTNEIAHELTAKFGSLINILTAPVDELCKIKYINKSVAADIRFFGEMYRFLTGYDNGRQELTDFLVIRDIIEKNADKNKYCFLIVTQNEKGELNVRKQDDPDLFSVQMEILSDIAVKIITIEAFPPDVMYSQLPVQKIINDLNTFCGSNNIEYVDHYVCRNDVIDSMKENDMF